MLTTLHSHVLRQHCIFPHFGKRRACRLLVISRNQVHGITAPLLTAMLLSAAHLPANEPINSANPNLESRTAPGLSAFWREPADIRARDLFYGAGGKQHEPVGPFTFLREDREGTSPKFSVRDANGVKWKVKLGVEARPEIAASRIVWATGYYVDEDYFVADLKVEKMQKLHRGEHLVSPDGSFRNVRLERDNKKIGAWKWRHNPFEGTRAWNGLRVLMCLINNWDLKDVNTAIRLIDGRPVYLISDLGASFGAGGWRVSVKNSKGNPEQYERSRFISKLTPEYVSFDVPDRPELFHRLMWIGRRIPRADARWIGDLLGNLSPDQIQAAFRGAGYEPADAERFSAVVKKRIQELKNL